MFSMRSGICSACLLAPLARAAAERAGTLKHRLSFPCALQVRLPFPGTVPAPAAAGLDFRQ
jgi:hypothetical protein